MHSVIIACTITTLITTYIYIASFKVQLSQQLHCSVSYRWGYLNTIHSGRPHLGNRAQFNAWGGDQLHVDVHRKLEPTDVIPSYSHVKSWPSFGPKFRLWTE